MVTVLDVLEPTTRGDTPMAAERHADAPVTYTGAAGLLIDGYTPPVRLRQIGNVALTGRGLPMSPPLPHPMPRRARFKAQLTQLGVLCGGGGTAWAVQDLVHADPALGVAGVVGGIAAGWAAPWAVWRMRLARGVRPSATPEDAARAGHVVVLTRRRLDTTLQAMRKRRRRLDALGSVQDPEVMLTPGERQVSERALAWGIADLEALVAEWDALTPAPEVMRVVILPEVVHLVAQLQTRGPEAATRTLNALVESEGLDHALEAEDTRALDAGTSRSDADPARPRRREASRRRRP